MAKFTKESLNQKEYAVNGTTLLSILGVCFSPIVGFIALINAAGGLFCTVMYWVKGDSILHAGLLFLVATVFFIVAVLSKKSFSYCYSQLQQQKLLKE